MVSGDPSRREPRTRARAFSFPPLRDPGPAGSPPAQGPLSLRSAPAPGDPDSPECLAFRGLGPPGCAGPQGGVCVTPRCSARETEAGELSSEQWRGVALEAPSARSPGLCVGWGQADSGSSTRGSCCEWGGNWEQLRGPSGTLSTLLPCQGCRAGPGRLGRGPGFITPPGGCPTGTNCPWRPEPPAPQSHRESHQALPLPLPGALVPPGREQGHHRLRSRPPCCCPGPWPLSPKPQGPPRHLSLRPPRRCSQCPQCTPSGCRGPLLPPLHLLVVLLPTTPLPGCTHASVPGTKGLCALGGCP